MARMESGPLAGIHGGDGWRLIRNLLGGLVILAIWAALWTWVAVGVVRPLSALTGGHPPPSTAERT